MMLAQIGAIASSAAAGSSLVDPVSLSYVHGCYETLRENLHTYVPATTAQGVISYDSSTGQYGISTGPANPRPWQVGETINITGIVPDGLYDRAFPTSYTVVTRTDANNYVMTSPSAGPVDAGTASGTGGVKLSTTTRLLSYANPGAWGSNLSQSNASLTPRIGTIGDLACLRERDPDAVSRWVSIVIGTVSDVFRQGWTMYAVVRRTAAMTAGVTIGGIGSTTNINTYGRFARSSTIVRMQSRANAAVNGLSQNYTPPADSWILYQLASQRVSDVLGKNYLYPGTGTGSGVDYTAAWTTLVLTNWQWGVFRDPQSTSQSNSLAIAAFIVCDGVRLNDTVILDWFRNHPTYAAANGGTGIVMPAA